MVSLTIGYVSGLIAAAVAVAQFIVPNALVFVLVAALSDRHSAVTWSVVARSLSNSYWPLFLGSDQTTSHKVSRRVSLIAWLRPIVLLLIAVAAIVTPMGLYDMLTASKDPTSTSFSYVQDRGPLGLGTLPRSERGFSRVCAMVCPGSTGSVDFGSDGAWDNMTSDGLDYRLPEDLVRLYQSGLTSQKSTVSSFFDIEERLYNIAFNADQGNTTYLQESFRQLGTFILENETSLVEGLVIDAQNSRFAFRNHTAPTYVQFGAEWEEDLLFFEPETACVDLNLTLEYETQPQTATAYAAVLIDNGGFADMDIASPWVSKMGSYLWYDGTQEDPQLGWRARSSAWSTNVFIAYFMNITKPGDRAAYMNSTIGNRINVTATPDAIQLNQIDLTTEYYSFLADIPLGVWDGNGTMQTFNSSIPPTTSWANPFQITTENFTKIEDWCEGVGSYIGGTANITNILVKCGLVLGVFQPVDGESTLVPRPYTKWRRPIYSCASTTKASIKTVRFRYNSTSSDSQLMNHFEVVDIADKTYSDSNPMPVWGVENANMSVLDVDPLWGIIVTAEVNHVNLSTVQADHLYLLAGQTSVFSSGEIDASDYIPAATEPGRAWLRTYEASNGRGSVDYSGTNSISLYQKWNKLTQTSEGTAKMLNMIWMDQAANAMVGTRGQLSTKSLPPNLQSSPARKLKREAAAEPGLVPVHLYYRAIRYRWAYGIPAFIALFVVALICLWALAVLVLGRASSRRVKHYLWNLSAGRIFTTFIYPGSSDMHSRTDEWIQRVGAREITIVDDPSSPSLGQADADLATVSTSYQQVAQDEHSAKQDTKERTTELQPVARYSAATKRQLREKAAGDDHASS